MTEPLAAEPAATSRPDAPAAAATTGRRCAPERVRGVVGRGRVRRRARGGRRGESRARRAGDRPRRRCGWPSPRPTRPIPTTTSSSQLRVPRTVVGLLAGTALGLAGMLIQGVTRNPIADPGLLGVNAGASLAVVLSISFLGVTSPFGYIWFAFAGAAVAAVLVFAIGRSQPVRLALVGAALTALLTPLIALVLLRDTEAFNQYRFWAVGSLTGRDLSTVAAPLAVRPRRRDHRPHARAPAEPARPRRRCRECTRPAGGHHARGIRRGARAAVRDGDGARRPDRARGSRRAARGSSARRQRLPVDRRDLAHPGADHAARGRCHRPAHRAQRRARGRCRRGVPRGSGAHRHRAQPDRWPDSDDHADPCRRARRPSAGNATTSPPVRSVRSAPGRGVDSRS